MVRRTSVLLVAVGLWGLAWSAMASPKLGGVQDAQVTDDVKEASQFAAVALNAGNSHCQSLQSARNGLFTVKRINSVKTQVVAGTVYNIDMVLTDGSSQEYPVQVSVWSRPWLKNRNDLPAGEAPMVLTSCNYDTA